MGQHNKRILDFLSYYLLAQESPRYAVMLDGPWGAGKTFLWHAAFREFEKARPLQSKVCYVSLFGLTSADDFNVAVVTALHPIMFSKTGRAVGHVLRVGLSRLGANPNLNVQDLVDKHTADVYVFDDLERCEMGPARVLGLINEFVEHDGAKVIVIGNEAEIDGTDQLYKRRREKVIGQTFSVQPQVDEAFTSFLDEMENNDARSFLAARRDQARGIFADAGHGNLRVLRRTLAEFGRLWAVLEAKHIEKTQALEEVMRLFFALSLELRSGQIIADDLERRRLPQRKRENGGDDSIDAARRRHTTDISNEIISTSLLRDMLGESQFDKKAICAHFDQAIQFTGPAPQPAWHVLWYRDDHTIEEVKAALTAVDDQFKTFDFVEPGEILHVFSLRLALSRAKIISDSPSSVVSSAQTYIDALLKAGKLPPASPDSKIGLPGGAFGLSYAESGSEEFERIVRFIADKRRHAERATYASKAIELKNLLQENPAAFSDRIAYRHDAENDPRLLMSPILAEMPVAEFTTIFLGLPPLGQKAVLTAIYRRHTEGPHHDLVEERPWIREMTSMIRAHTELAEPIERDRLYRLTYYRLEPLLDAWEPPLEEPEHPFDTSHDT